MRILAIDPGLTMAWACEEDGVIIDIGVEYFELAPDEEQPPVYPDVVAAAYDKMLELVHRLSPDQVVIEMPDIGSKYIPIMVGAAMLTALRNRDGGEVLEVPPSARAPFQEQAKQVRLEFGPGNPHIRDAMAHAWAQSAKLRKLSRRATGFRIMKDDQ